MEKKETIFTNDLSREVFESTYKFGDETVNNMFRRIAKELASVEKDKEKWEEKFYEVLTDFKFVPGGRIISNAGLGLKGTSLINCFVSGFEGENQDSMPSILDELRRQALILGSEGGYGFCADVIRPRGGLIAGIANGTPGSITMLEMWDTQSKVITEGAIVKMEGVKTKKKIRKGAQMVTLSCWHGDIEEFITAKQTPGRLTKFNMSVLVTDEFIEAVKNNQPWNLIFPDFDTDKEFYNKHWDGNIKKWKELGGKIKIYKTFEDANELWDLIMQSTYNRNEPGVLFIDTINRLNNLKYIEYINSSNPCGEQMLPKSGVCLLGSINLTQFLNLKEGNFDLKKLKQHLPFIIRMLDNVNDITYVPLPGQKENLISKRRIGLGVMGYGSSLLILKKKYGSQEVLKLTEELMGFLANESYKISSELAVEKGKFPLFTDEYNNSNFIKVLSDDTRALIKKNGLRNSHLLTVAPTGNSGILANCVSGGLEPVFLFEYNRTSSVTIKPENLILPTSIDWSNKSVIGQDGWVWIKEGDENLLRKEFEGIIYKIDKNRGLTKESLVEDYGVRILKERGEWDPKADWACNTNNLLPKEHVDTMKVFASKIDSSISKTINLPANYPYKDFKEIYLNAHQTSVIKGVTTYRANTMASVLSEIKKEEDVPLNKIIRRVVPKRPKSLPCDIYHVKAQGQEWVVLVGILEEEPFEVFAFKKTKIKIPVTTVKGTLVKIKSGLYSLDLDGFVFEDIGTLFEKDEQEALTRMTSLSLKCGANLAYVVEQLNKSEGTVVSFARAIARTLKRYISDGTTSSEICKNCGAINSMIYEEGCLKCRDCGSAKCG